MLDFNWLRKEKSPNWNIASLSQFLLDHNTLLALLKRAMGFSFVRIDSGQVGMLEDYFYLFETQSVKKTILTKRKWIPAEDFVSVQSLKRLASE